jgi:thiamine monophosphate kinase
MIDLSDGLGGDATRLAEQSGVALRIDAARLPLAAGAAEVAAAAGRDPMQLAVSGGEDYELLVALPPERLAEAASSLAEASSPGGTASPGGAAGVPLTQIGEVVASEAMAEGAEEEAKVAVREGAGEQVEIRLPDGRFLTPSGFDQLG